MRRTRVIPTLLLQGKGLVKTKQFSNAKYIGDPLNAVKIFNEKGVDELAVLDIGATERGSIDVGYLREFAEEAFVPVCYGGGINSMSQAEEIFKAGVEKVSINTVAIEQPELIKEMASVFGSQSVVVSVDVKKTLFGKYVVFNTSGKGKKTKWEPSDYAQYVESLGAGEIILNSVDLDGTGKGYDTQLIQSVSGAISVPLIACGGAGNINDFKHAVDAGASAVGAGRMFVFQGKHDAVLISYPDYSDLDSILP
ncbi:AglZ/HisF2 family acetamidino modification protein [Pseudomonadota bacterium]